jgi:hypothetical protein
VAGDARAFLAERLLGNLDDHVLTCFQHFADELRAARRAGMAAVTAIMPGSTGTARTAFESWAARASAVRTTIGTAATAVWAATAAAITSSALWTLETGARIAADAGGIAREIFARSSGAADARGSGFAGKQDDVVFDDGWSRGDFSCARFDQFCFGMFMFGVLMLGMRVFRESVHGVFGITESGSVFSAFVRGVRFEFGAIRGAVLFDFLGFSLGEFCLRGSLIFGGIEVRFFLAFFFLGFFVLRKFGFASGVNFLGFVIFFKFGAAYEGIGLDVIGGFLVFCLHELGRKGHNLVFAQFDFAARGH